MAISETRSHNGEQKMVFIIVLFFTSHQTVWNF